MLAPAAVRRGTAPSWSASGSWGSSGRPPFARPCQPVFTMHPPGAVRSSVQGLERVVLEARPPPILTREEVLDKLEKNRRHAKIPTFKAFFSSVVGGVTRDPAAMVVPIDDHMVHRGHAVFDTAIIASGKLYELEEHLDRLLRSALAAKIKPHFSRDELRGFILATAAASGVHEGYLRYWLSVGPGGFSISPSECETPAFYVLATASELPKTMPPGVKVISARTPMKSSSMATTKTVNYLPNALAHLEAEEAGVCEAIWVDNEGLVGEGPTMNVAFVSEDGFFLVPSFEKILAGCTVQRVMQLAQRLVSPAAVGTPSQEREEAKVREGGSENEAPALLKGVKFGPLHESDARRAAEMMLIGSGTQVTPVVEWDGTPIGTGTPGPVAFALHKLLLEDHRTGPLTPIPHLYDT